MNISINWLVYRIGILSVFVFAEAMGPGCARLVQPYDGTVWNNPPLSLPPGVIHGTYHSAVMNVEVGYKHLSAPAICHQPDPVLSGDLLVARRAESR